MGNTFCFLKSDYTARNSDSLHAAAWTATCVCYCLKVIYTARNSYTDSDFSDVSWPLIKAILISWERWCNVCILFASPCSLDHLKATASWNILTTLVHISQPSTASKGFREARTPAQRNNTRSLDYQEPRTTSLVLNSNHHASNILSSASVVNARESSYTGTSLDCKWIELVVGKITWLKHNISVQPVILKKHKSSPAATHNSTHPCDIVWRQ